MFSENPTTPDEFVAALTATLQRFQDIGWVDRFEVRGPRDMTIQWNKKSRVSLAMLRNVSLEAKLTDTPGLARMACWLAESYGPDIVK